MKNFVEELRWRGMIHDIMPGTEDELSKGMCTAYLGIDPTADSLHIGHLVGVMMLRHFQQCGHRPIALIGGATGMIGDPSMKSAERNLLDEVTLRKNQEGIKKQLSKFLDFDSNDDNAAILLNNYDWMKDYGFLHFIRDIGKNITVNYMMAKDSVKKRLGSESSDGMSFTEFSYQLLQGYDFLHLYGKYECKLQMGGSDQWGNITTGTELIRKISKGEAFALTCPLITKSDGSKFGKTESGNVWLDPQKTSPYRFYQFWINVSDEDASRYIRIFTSLTKIEIEDIEKRHQEAPHQRLLQKKLAEELTVMVHSRDDYNQVCSVSDILFGAGTRDMISSLSPEIISSVFEGVPRFEIDKSEFFNGIKLIDLLTDKSSVFSSRGEYRKMIQSGGLSLNKEKISEVDTVVTLDNVISDKYLIIQKGKKNYFLFILK